MSTKAAVSFVFPLLKRFQYEYFPPTLLHWKIWINLLGDGIWNTYNRTFILLSFCIFCLALSFEPSLPSYLPSSCELRSQGVLWVLPSDLSEDSCFSFRVGAAVSSQGFDRKVQYWNLKYYCLWNWWQSWSPYRFSKHFCQLLVDFQASEGWKNTSHSSFSFQPCNQLRKCSSFDRSIFHKNF